MKKILLLLAALTVIAACYPDIETSEVESNAKTVKVKAGKAGTKTAISQNGDTFSFTWTAGDKLAVIEAVPSIAQFNNAHDDEDHGYATAFYYSKPLAEDMSVATFSLNLEKRDYVSGELQYVATYPASCAIEVAGDCWDYEKGRPIVTIDFPREQHPTSTSFDPEADVLVSRIVTCQDVRPEELTFQFARVGTIIKMVLTGLPEGATITGGELQLNMEVGYHMEYDPVDQKLIGQDGTDGIGFYYGNTPLVVGADRSATIWLRCMSGVSDHIYLTLDGTVNGEEAYWTRHVKLYLQGKTLEFKEGGLTTFSLKMGKPDVDNPDPDLIDYYTNDNLDGVTVFWPLPENPNLEGYECFLLDANGGRHNFDTKGPDGSLFKATINSGLAPGIYSFSVRALAVEGKESQNDFAGKEELYIGIPICETISYTGSHNPTWENKDYDLSFPGYDDVDTEDLYRGLYYFHRNMDWHTGSPNYFYGSNYTKRWAFWNKTPVRWESITVTPYSSSADNSKFDVYGSNSIFAGGVPSTSDTPVTGTHSNGYVYQLGRQKYFLIIGNSTFSMTAIELKYYK